MNRQALVAYLKKDAELWKKVLMDAYIRLHQAYPNDPNARNKALVAAFPGEKKAVEDFIANTGNLPESVHEVSKAVAHKKVAENPKLRSLVFKVRGLLGSGTSVFMAGSDPLDGLLAVKGPQGWFTQPADTHSPHGGPYSEQQVFAEFVAKLKEWDESGELDDVDVTPAASTVDLPDYTAYEAAMGKSAHKKAAGVGEKATKGEDPEEVKLIEDFQYDLLGLVQEYDDRVKHFVKEHGADASKLGELLNGAYEELLRLPLGYRGPTGTTRPQTDLEGRPVAPKAKPQKPVEEYHEPTEEQLREHEDMQKGSAKYSPKAQEFIGEKMHKLKEEGKPQDQAEAQAINMAREKGLKVPEKSSAQIDLGEVDLEAIMAMAYRVGNTDLLEKAAALVTTTDLAVPRWLKPEDKPLWDAAVARLEKEGQPATYPAAIAIFKTYKARTQPLPEEPSQMRLPIRTPEFNPGLR